MLEEQNIVNINSSTLDISNIKQATSQPLESSISVVSQEVKDPLKEFLDTTPIEQVEQDTGDSEDLSFDSILQLIIPNSDVQKRNISQFGMHYNMKIFHGWVKQPSPCCGAAVVAGAWNALFHLHRSDPNALNHLHIIEIYKEIFQEMIRKKRLSFERKFGSSIEEILCLIESKAKEIGKELGGKKHQSITKKILLNISKSIVENTHLSLNSFVVNQDSVEPPSPMMLFMELLQSDGHLNPMDHEINENMEDDIGSDDETDEKTIDTEHLKNKNAKNVKKWDWLGDLHEILKNMSGLIRLSLTKPSTASIGNWGIIQAFEKLSEKYSLGTMIYAYSLMGKSKLKIEVPLSIKDSESTINSQWDKLRSSFARNDIVLILHYNNHYALLYATREWISTEDLDDSNSNTLHSHHETIVQSDLKGTLCDQCIINPSESIPNIINPKSRRINVRQVLTARKGQRPNAWVDFEEIRKVLLQWDGYKIIACKKKTEE